MSNYHACSSRGSNAPTKKKVVDDPNDPTNYIVRKVSRVHDVLMPSTEVSTNNIVDTISNYDFEFQTNAAQTDPAVIRYKNSRDYFRVKHELYNAGIEMGFELFRKYAQHADAGSTKWDKIEINEAVTTLGNCNP